MPLRPATVADAPAIVDLLRKAPTAAQWSEAQLLQILFDRPTSRFCMVMEERGIMQAFLAARCVVGECELENIVVDAAVQRKGIGGQLVAALLECARARQIASIFLEVRASNSAARLLYEKFGFEVASRRPHYYRNPLEDAVIYRFRLSESAS